MKIDDIQCGLRPGTDPTRGAHAPSRVEFSALAEPSLASVSDGGVADHTRGRVCSSKGIWVGLSFMAMLCLFTALTLPVRAADAENAFDAANNLYDQGKYSAAAAGYDQLIAGGKVSEAVYFNRGNALFKMGQVGRAIASYRQAQLLSPRDRDVRENLQFARTRARGGSIYREPRWRMLLETVSVNEWTLLTVAAFWVFFILLAACERQRELKARFWNGIVASAAATVIFATCLAITFNNLYSTNSAIVVAGEVEVRNGPLEDAPGLFKVRDGAELEVLDQKDGWYQVMDPAQRVGWLRQEEALIFTPATAQKGKG